MTISPVDAVLLEEVGGSSALSFDAYTSLTIKNSIVEQAEASFEVGNDGSFGAILERADLGAKWRVTVNGRLRLTGRIETFNAPADAQSSTVQRFVVRTRISDALYASAPIGLTVKGVSVKAFLLACYENIGLTEKDFDFRGDVGRDLITGKATKGGKAPVDLEPLKEDQAKTQTGETVFAAVDRHLRRHGLLHYDGPDGKIIVAAPDDTQTPIYNFRVQRGAAGATNNVRSVERSRDASGAPTTLGVFGVGGGKDFSKAKVQFTRINPELTALGFRRAVVIVDEGVKSRSLAERRSNREYSTRVRGLDTLSVVMDGLSFRDGSSRVEFGPDTVADVTIVHAGGALGAYYVETVNLARNVGGDSATLSLVKKGAWVL